MINVHLSSVISPNMYNSKLWETSGHWQNYDDGMFILDIEKDKWALKPMNCPGHCLIFDSRDRSYRELPIRMAEFGIIHRNEASGALTGLTRVRRFVQDDTHVFCMPSQVGLTDLSACSPSHQYADRWSKKSVPSLTSCSIYTAYSGLSSTWNYPPVLKSFWEKLKHGTMPKK
jgi:glycyl-tRNA synthetase (class II)